MGEPLTPERLAGCTLVLGLYFPNMDPETDAELVADNVALTINEERVRNGGADTVGFDTPEVEPVGVDLFPTPQWLMADTLAKLRDQTALLDTIDAQTAVMKDALWQFNEAVSLLREARQYVAEATGCADDIDDALPAIQTALEKLAALADMWDPDNEATS